MQRQLLELLILSPLQSVYSGPVISLRAPADLGYLEILPGHATLTAVLKKGNVTAIDQAGSSSTFAISGGALNISKNKAVLLLDNEP